MSITRRTAWILWLLASFFYAYQYILRVMPNIMLDDIIEQFDMGGTVIGQFSGIYYIGYALFHLPVGMMLDRYGPKKIMTGCILLAVLGLMPLIFSDHWLFPIAGRALVGIGSSAAILGLFKIVRLSFSTEQFSRMLSLAVTIGLIGAIYGGGPVSYMKDLFGFHGVVQILAIGGIFLAAVTYLLIPEIKITAPGSTTANLKHVLGNRKVLLTCLFAGLMVGPLEGFADVWGRAFLRDVYGLDGALAATLPSSIFIGMCFGAPIISFIAEKTKSPMATMIGSGLAMIISFSSLLIWQLSAGAVTFHFILVGICCGYQILAICKVSSYVPEEAAGLAAATANMIIMTFGYIFHATMGSIINAMGGPASPQALVYGVAVIPAGLLLGTLGFAFLLVKERTKEKAELLSFN